MTESEAVALAQKLIELNRAPWDTKRLNGSDGMAMITGAIMLANFVLQLQEEAA